MTNIQEGLLLKADFNVALAQLSCPQVQFKWAEPDPLNSQRSCTLRLVFHFLCLIS